MRLLILSSFSYKSISGQGVILTNTIDYLLNNKIDFDLIYFRVDKTYEISSNDLINAIENFDLPQISYKCILNSILGLNLNELEKNFLDYVSIISNSYNHILLFASAYDPLVMFFPKYLTLPITYNITDSITLFERNRITSGFNIRILVAKLIEKKILALNYKNLVYVGFKDSKCAKKLINDKFNRVVHIPLGVNTNVFSPPVNTNYNHAPIILFTGILSYLPNEEACIYILDKILPQISNNYLFRIVGKNPSDRLLNVASKNKFVQITGYVEDISEEYRKADIYLCPMQSGAGMKNKILEALSTGLPVITSFIEKESFENPPNCISFCKSDFDYVQTVEYYLMNESDRISHGILGREYVLKSLDWNKRSRKLIALAE